MKSLLLSALFVCAAAAANAADAPSVNGDWKIHISIAGNDNDLTCSFVQKEADLTGTCKSDQGSVPLTGKVEEKKVSWKYKIEYNGSPLTLTYSGTLESAEKLTGTVTVEEYNVDGEFSGVPAK